MSHIPTNAAPSRRFSVIFLFGVLAVVLGCLIQIRSNIFWFGAPVTYPNSSDKLSYLEQISSYPFHGCESLVYFNGTIYTGTAEGKIVKLDSAGVHFFSDLSGCLSDLKRTRPLGIRLSLDTQRLFIVDAFQGLFSVTLSSGKCTKVFPLDDHFKVTFFNDLDILPNGTILISESSTNYDLENIMQIIYEENPSGRVLSIDPDTGRWQVLLDGLSFSNGIQLHRDKKSVLIAETATSRILRLSLDGGNVSVFADALPGMPDNLRESPRGGYWAPVINADRPFFKRLSHLAREWSVIRWIVLKASTMSLFKNLKNSKSAMLLRLDENGEIIEAILDPTGRVRNVAEVCEHDGVLFTGSYFLPYIGRLQL